VRSSSCVGTPSTSAYTLRLQYDEKQFTDVTPLDVTFFRAPGGALYPNRADAIATASGAEVDFVIERKRKLLAIEVKAGAAPGPRDVAHLKTFCAEYESEAGGGVILHGGDESYWLGDRILAVPWWQVM
jgi:hypothetical protein